MSNDSFAQELEGLRAILMRRAITLSKNADEAADLVQTTMLKALQHRGKFEAGTNLAAWATTILRNSFLSDRRKFQREVDWDDAYAETIADDHTASQDDHIEFTETMEMLRGLGQEQREALSLVANGMSYEDAAKQTGVAEGTVKSRVHRARTKLEGLRDGMDAPVRQRRFEEVNRPSPEDVKPLTADHPAILQGLPLFETTMVHAKDSPRILISGMNSRKIGKVVTKGAWKGFPIYMLTLAERLTCPSSCHMWTSCYGNAMPFARRHRPGEDLEIKLADEVDALAEHHAQGFVIRLHVLGDFYSEAYVRLWERLLEAHPKLHVFGYTARMRDTAAPAIGNALFQVRNKFPDRFCIRPSEPKPLPGAAVVIDHLPDGPTVAEGIVCPAEREATACCATCGLCWEKSARDRTIVFLKHGLGSRKTNRVAADASMVDALNSRSITPIAQLAKLATAARNDPPTLLWIKPTELRVDETYQRNLSNKSIRLISRIVQNWNWSHFKPPIVVKDEDRNEFFIIDGQHTAIAAASHPKIDRIPVMAVDAETLSDRARGFIAHNRDRITVTPVQLHYSSIVAGDAQATEIDRVCDAAGVRIIRTLPANGQFAVGETMALASIRGLIRKYGAERTVTVLSTLVLAERSPVRADEMKALALLMADASSAHSPDEIAEMLRVLPYETAVRDAKEIALSSQISSFESLAVVYAQSLAAPRPLETAA